MEDARPIEPGQSPVSSALAITTDDQHLLIAAEDHNTLVVVNRQTMKVSQQIPVSRGPAHVIVDENDTAYVTTRFGHQLHIIDISTGEEKGRIKVGAEPQGLTLLKDGQVAVALSGESAIAIVDKQLLKVSKKIDLPDADPRAVAQDRKGRVIVSHMSSGRISVLNEDYEVSKSISMSTRVNTGPAVHPNHIRMLTLNTDGSGIVTAHSQSNDQIVRAPMDPSIVEIHDMEPQDDCEEDEGCGTQEPDAQSSDCGYGGCANELGAIVPTITKVDLEEDTVVIPTKQRITQNDFEIENDPATILNPSDDRFLLNMAIHNPVGSALVDGGRGILVVNTGTQNVVLLRNQEMNGSRDDFIGTAEIGNGPKGIAITHDGTTAYIFNLFDGSITELALPLIESRNTQPQDSLLKKAEPNQVAHGFDGFGEVNANDSIFMHSVTHNILENVLPPDIAYGRILFHTATDERISASGNVSCASCHPDGRSDNITWRFNFGPRNTPQLGGSILDSAPFHWPGDVTRFDDLETATVQAFMGGHGLGADMGVVASYLDSLPAAPNKSHTQEGLSAAQERGKKIFENAEVGCSTCHSGPHYSNNINVDIGSKASPFDRSDFQVPVMHGLLRSAPYMHDGSAKDLEELVYQWVKTDRMGKGSHLTETELSDLIRFLETL